jgi:uncharacterized membrane protein YeaQ/YmgE (transglycosylase-associated protein family)
MIGRFRDGIGAPDGGDGTPDAAGLAALFDVPARCMICGRIEMRGGPLAPEPPEVRTANRRSRGMGIGTLIGWIVVGAIAGWIAEKILGRDDSLMMNIIIGIVGAVVGGWLFGLIFGASLTSESGWIWSILVSVAGAVILLWIVGMIRGRRA